MYSAGFARSAPRRPVGADDESRYQKIVASIADLHNRLVEQFVRLRGRAGAPRELTLDLDATDDPVHGDQLGRFFHGDYGHDCYLPLYLLCGDWPLLALLRPADQDGVAGSVPHLARIVARLRETWPEVRIMIRGDSGFCREGLMVRCARYGVDYLLEVDYPETETVTLVCDNLNTHSIASLYHTFDAETAGTLRRRLRLVFTPKNGSWLNMAEMELSVLSRQCLGQRRFESAAALDAAVAAWTAERNLLRRGTNWRFTTDDAGIKLQSLYPQLDV